MSFFWDSFVVITSPISERISLESRVCDVENDFFSELLQVPGADPILDLHENLFHLGFVALNIQPVDSIVNLVSFAIFYRDFWQLLRGEKCTLSTADKSFSL